MIFPYFPSIYRGIFHVYHPAVPAAARRLRESVPSFKIRCLASSGTWVQQKADGFVETWIWPGRIFWISWCSPTCSQQLSWRCFSGSTWWAGFTTLTRRTRAAGPASGEMLWRTNHPTAGQSFFSGVVFTRPGELPFCHGKSPFFMGKFTISMAIFHCYVSSPEGNSHSAKKIPWSWKECCFCGTQVCSMSKLSLMGSNLGSANSPQMKLGSPRCSQDGSTTGAVPKNKDYSLPQSRARVYIVGVHKSLEVPLWLQSGTNWLMSRIAARILWKLDFFRGLLHTHDGSMVLVYMLTWLGYIDGIHVTLYGSTMDPSWDSSFRFCSATRSM